ncbi:MAG: DNA recombination protein RmuC [Spirochaetes bacterium]|nr:DNA recombination protein RmuC [Spirochaetota bacterium]
MSVTFIEIIIAASSLLTLGALAGYFLSRKVIHRNAATMDDLNAIRQAAASLQAQLDEKVKALAARDAELSREREARIKLSGDAAAKDAQIKSLAEQMESRKKEIEDLNAKFTEEFRKVANQLFINHSGQFTRLTSEHLGQFLKPFREQIDKFEKKIDSSRESQVKESASLKEQISQLASLNQTMSLEARNLANALKNESKTRGNWGEMILEKILESSGLIRDEHYTVQTSLRGEENNRLQPDVIIHLPEEKHLIIDSKVSLVDYERYCNAPDENDRNAYLINHINSIYGHVENLSSKEYQKAFGVNPPDFVLMFVPVEAALLTALERDRDLFGYAWQKNIAVISPTTLIPTLKIIHNIWRQESQNRNALAIASTGGKLYDKFAGFLNDLLQIGKCIDNARGSYDDALKKLSTGRGNILSMAEKMKEMGAKASKQLPMDVDEDEDGDS